MPAHRCHTQLQGPQATESPRPQAERHSKLGAQPRASPRVPKSCASCTQDTVGVSVTQSIALRAASCVRRLPSCPCSLRFTVCPRGPPCDAARVRVSPAHPEPFVANLNDGSTFNMRGVDRHTVSRKVDECKPLTHHATLSLRTCTPPVCRRHPMPFKWHRTAPDGVGHRSSLREPLSCSQEICCPKSTIERISRRKPGASVFT
jgi:hypothetical protein